MVSIVSIALAGVFSLLECLAAENSIVKQQTPVAAAGGIAGRRTRLTDFPSGLAVSPIRALRSRNSIPFKDEMRQKNAWHRAVLDRQALELRTW
jgi:hypothetical protein